MKYTLSIFSLVWTLSSFALARTVQLGQVQKLCYTDLNNTCAIYHTKGYQDGLDRLYLPPAVMYNDPAYLKQAEDNGIKIELWTTETDELLHSPDVVPEYRSAQQDLMDYGVIKPGEQVHEKRGCGIEAGVCGFGLGLAAAGIGLAVLEVTIAVCAVAAADCTA